MNTTNSSTATSMCKRSTLTGLFLLLLLACNLIATFAYADQRAQPTLPSVTLAAGSVEINAELARTQQQRYMGLSFRTAMPENSGMLFVYAKEQTLNFVMRNTFIPLSIAYLSKDMVINEIHDMQVGSKTTFPSRQPAQFALEMNQGWFKRNGVKVGSQLTMKF